MKRLIIADVKSNNNHGKNTGHYFAVAQNYLDLYSDCCEVKVAGGPIFRQRFGEKDLLELPYDFKFSRNWLLDKWKVLMNCRSLFRQTASDDVVVIQQSGLSTAIMGIALFAPRRRSIYIIAYDTDALSSFSKRMIYAMAKPKISGLLCPAPHVARDYGMRSCVVTDYICPYSGLRNALPYDDRGYDIGILGGMSPDKGILEAATFLAGKKYKVLIAGKADDRMASQMRDICKDSPNIDLRIGYLSEPDFHRYIRASRFCLLNYNGVYADRSSGVVLDMIFGGTPIIGHKCKALEFVEKENVGTLFDSLQDCDLSQIINKEKHYEFLNGISSYIQKQAALKTKVIKFLEFGISPF